MFTRSSDRFTEVRVKTRKSWSLCSSKFTTVNSLTSISSSQVSLGAASFFGDNFYGQAQVVLGNVDNGVDEAMSSTGYGVGLGKYIPVKDMWFISPQLNYTAGSNDAGSSSGAEIRIQFGASF